MGDQIRLHWPDGSRFHAPDRDPSVDLDAPLESIDNLNNDVEPAADNSGRGTGPSNSISPANELAAYASCASSLSGVGQTIGVGNPWGSCYGGAAVNAFWQSTGLAQRSGLGVPQIYSDAPNNGACDAGGSEATLDVEMALALAPNALVYFTTGGGSYNTMLGNWASAGTSIGQVSLSAHTFSPDLTRINLINELALQGQSFLISSGDNGPYNDGGLPDAQIYRYGTNVEQAVTVVGGTALTMTDGGAYAGESAWTGTGGGPMNGPDSMLIPGYQVAAATGQGNGVSAYFRNVPDVSFPAASVEQVQGNPPVTSPGNGTSFAAPAFASWLALVNQQASSSIGPNGYIGFANPAIYAAAASNYGEYFHDITAGFAKNPYLTYNAAPGYDLATGLGSPTCSLLTYLSSVNPGGAWAMATNNTLTCVSEIAGSETSGVAAWAIGCGTGDKTIYSLPALGYTWQTAPGVGAIHIAVSPQGVPWVLNTYGTAYQLVNAYTGAACSAYSTSCYWASMNTAGNSGPHSRLSSIAPGNNGTAWATSQTASGSDFTVYTYSGGTDGSGTWTLFPGAAFQQISSSNVSVVSRNHNGTSFSYVNGTWTALEINTRSEKYGSYTGQAKWIAASPSSAEAHAWMIANNTPWRDGSPDDLILELVQQDDSTSAANVWTPTPGGATQVSVSTVGHAWVVNNGGVAFVETGYPQ